MPPRLVADAPDAVAAERYELVAGWGESLPPGIRIGDVGGIGVDRDDRVYVFNRSEHPVIVLDRDGAFLGSWGEGRYVTAHGVSMGPDDTIYLTDTGRHTVTKCSLDGEVLLEIGVPGAPSPYMSGIPFNCCTHTAHGPDGSIYVSDGYGNARIHRFSAAGERLLSWGASGTGPGEFNVPHNIVCDADGVLHVADRENHRVQRFDERGEFLGRWNDLHRPCALALDPWRPGRFFVGEAGPGLAVNIAAPNLGQRVVVLDAEGRRIGGYGSGVTGEDGDDFVAPHGIAVDSEGSLYIGEVAEAAWPDFHRGATPTHPVRTIRKVRRA